MIFHEIYGCYYKSTAQIIKLAINNKLDKNSLKQAIDNNAFSESHLEIIPALMEQKWQLIGKDFSTPIKNEPTLPLTTLEKRWLKAVSLDKRIALFDVDLSFLDDVEPLFIPDNIKYFDQSSVSDPFDDPLYIEHFQTMLKAIKEKQTVSVSYTNRYGVTKSFKCSPYKMEYSEKDDKFRLYTANRLYTKILNMASINDCKPCCCTRNVNYDALQNTPMHVVFELTDERNSLERVLLHFAGFEKEAEALGADRYKIRLFYDKNDEAEIVIRILSFGPHITVTQPDSFVQLIRSKLQMQYDFSKDKRKMFDD